MRVRCLLAAFVSVTALLLVACGTSSIVARPSSSTAAVGTPVTIRVVRRSWHIDVGFDADAVTGPLGELRQQFPGVRYLLFGFGDRRYLERHEHGLPSMLALWPGDGLILVTALTGSPAEAFGEQSVIDIQVSGSQAAAMLGRVSASLALHQGALQSEGPGPYAGSEYLRSTTRYSAAHTCNTWAAEVLESGGLPVQSRGVLFAAQLWRQVRAKADAPAIHGASAR